MEKESLAYYQGTLLKIIANYWTEADLFVIYDTETSAYKKTFDKAKEELEEEQYPASKKPLFLMLTDTLSHTGRLAMAAADLGYRGIVFYSEEESNHFLLTYFGDGPMETVRLSLSDLALPETDRSRVILAAALLHTLRKPGLSLLAAVDSVR